MGHAHPSTPAQRVQWASHLLAHAGEYGVVAALSRATGVSRPTLYAWRAQAQQALLHALAPVPPPPARTPTLERQVLTLYVNAHASSRGIQHCIATLTHQGISLATITQILQDAEQRALRWLATHVPPSVRALALDEIYANDPTAPISTSLMCTVARSGPARDLSRSTPRVGPSCCGTSKRAGSGGTASCWMAAARCKRPVGT